MDFQPVVARVLDRPCVEFGVRSGGVVNDGVLGSHTQVVGFGLVGDGAGAVGLDVNFHIDGLRTDTIKRLVGDIGGY